MNQSRTMSGIESVANVAIGFGLAFLMTLYVLPIWNIEPSAGQAFQITVAYTVLSLCRSYIVRRVFNAL